MPSDYVKPEDQHDIQIRPFEDDIEVYCESCQNTVALPGADIYNLVGEITWKALKEAVTAHVNGLKTEITIFHNGRQDT